MSTMGGALPIHCGPISHQGILFGDFGDKVGLVGGRRCRILRPSWADLTMAVGLVGDNVGRFNDKEADSAGAGRPDDRVI